MCKLGASQHAAGHRAHLRAPASAAAITAAAAGVAAGVGCCGYRLEIHMLIPNKTAAGQGIAHVWVAARVATSAERKGKGRLLEPPVCQASKAFQSRRAHCRLLHIC